MQRCSYFPFLQGKIAAMLQAAGMVSTEKHYNILCVFMNNSSFLVTML